MNKPSSHRPRKRFGQNFLQDDTVIGRIASAIAAQPTDHLVEIGPGQGALTEALVGDCLQIDVIELDRDLIPGLLAAFSIHRHLTLHQADALTFDFSALITGEEQVRVVGNLPYNISTPLIFKLLENASIIYDMHFMLQLEVVQRLAAKPGGKHWGRLGIMAQYRCDIEHLFDVPPEAFHPPPKVQSAIVRLTPRKQSRWEDCCEESLRRVVRSSFAQRRKTLRNNLKGLIDGAALQGLDIDPGARAETLTIDQFVRLAQFVERNT